MIEQLDDNRMYLRARARMGSESKKFKSINTLKSDITDSDSHVC